MCYSYESVNPALPNRFEIPSSAGMTDFDTTMRVLLLDIILGVDILEGVYYFLEVLT